MSLAELTVYARRHRLRVGITTNALPRQPTVGARMIAVYVSRPNDYPLIAHIGDPGGFAELDAAADELLVILRREAA